MGGLEDPSPEIPNGLSPYERLALQVDSVARGDTSDVMKHFAIQHEELKAIIATEYADLVGSGPIPDPSGLPTVANETDVDPKRRAAYERLISLRDAFEPEKRLARGYARLIAETQLIHLEPIASQESSVVFNGLNSVTGTLSTFKILLQSHDGYRNYSTLEKRHRELEQALKWSRAFNGETGNRGSFHGLCPVVSMVADHSRRAWAMNVGPVMPHPGGDMWWSVEYAFSTRFFHPAGFLEKIATKGVADGALESRHGTVHSREGAMVATLDALIEMDRTRAFGLSASSVERYGSVQHLHAKTRDNVAFLMQRLSDVPASDGLHEILTPQTVRELVQLIESVFTAPGPYMQWFVERARHNIKHCHGDVTTTNTVVDSVTGRIFFLDPVIGLPNMYNIDVISNAAMLLTDWKARTGDDQWEQIYLEKSDRSGDPCAEAVLAFYMLDKAVVKTGIAIGDKVPHLALAFAREVVRCMSNVRRESLNGRPNDG